MNDQIPSSAPGPHPTPEQLYRARRGPRNAEAERHLAHAVLCAECSAELTRLEAFDHPEELPQRELDAQWERFGPPEAARRPGRRSLPVFQRFAFAAAAVLALSIGFGLWSAARPNLPPAADAVRGADMPAASSFQPTGTIPSAPTELLFPAGDDTPSRVTVYDAAREFSWTSPAATGGRVDFPEAERRKLRPGVEYYWTVLGDDAAPAQTFRITSP